MSDYILREDAIMAAMDYNGCGNAQDASQDIAGNLASIPAANVCGIVEGWINDDDCCSICNSPIPTDDAHDYIAKNEVRWCYYCGAKLRED